MCNNSNHKMLFGKFISPNGFQNVQAAFDQGSPLLSAIIDMRSSGENCHLSPGGSVSMIFNTSDDGHLWLKVPSTFWRLLGEINFGGLRLFVVKMHCTHSIFFLTFMAESASPTSVTFADIYSHTVTMHTTFPPTYGCNKIIIAQ